MDKERKATIVEGMRWILVLPGSVVSAILVMFPIHWVVMLIQLFGKADDDAFVTIDGKTLLAAIPPEILERFGYALFVPMVLIICGAEIAPRFKFQTGIILAMLLVALCAFSIGYSFEKIEMSQLRWVVTIILWIVSYTYGLYGAYKAHKKHCNKIS
jgi:hypothetical protein